MRQPIFAPTFRSTRDCRGAWLPFPAKTSAKPFLNSTNTIMPIQDPNPAPTKDNPLDPDILNRRPSASGGPVVFSATSSDSTFQQFMWELVNALHIINLAQMSYKKLCYSGCPDAHARTAYKEALKHYDVVKARWVNELADETTFLDLSMDMDGYITDVRVISSAFSPFKPMQSSSLNMTHPYPSSSSSSSK